MTRARLKQLLPGPVFRCACAWVALGRALAQRYRKLRSRLKARRIAARGGTLKLELGAGNRRDGFLTIDLNPRADLVLDLSEPLPFPDASVEMVYSSHFLEHLGYHDVVALLREVHRVLKPGGEFSIVVPDASIFIRGYLAGGFDTVKYIGKDNQYFHDHGRLDVVNYVAYTDGEHKHMFDEENLLNLLRATGFQNPALRDFDPRLDLEVRRLVSLHARAIK